MRKPSDGKMSDKNIMNLTLKSDEMNRKLQNIDNKIYAQQQKKEEYQFIKNDMGR